MTKPITVIAAVLSAFILTLPTVAAPITPYPTAPLCAAHDDRAYHGLWSADLGCHYDHTHGDNPHELDDLLGVAIYAEMGGEISYPWQTANENANKHQGYIWVVRKNLSCARVPANNGCITDFRTVVHFHQDGHDTPIQFHSFVSQGRGCYQNVCGTWSFGGHQDTGDLLVNGATVIDNPNNLNCHKQHQSTNGMAVWYPCFRYGLGGPEGFGRSSLAIHNEWDKTSASNPSDYTDYVCYPNPSCSSNGAFVRPHLIKVDIPNVVDSLLDPDHNGRVDSYSGFTTQYGVVDPNCTAVSAVCVPLKFTNIVTAYPYIYRDTDPGRSYDVWFCGSAVCQFNSPGRRTSNWIQPLH